MAVGAANGAGGRRQRGSRDRSEAPAAARLSARSIGDHVLSVVRKDQERYQQRPLVVGLAGPPGSGKSTAARLAVEYISRGGEQTDGGCSGVSCEILPMDGFHYTRAQLDKFPDPTLAHARRGAPFTFDLEHFLMVLGELRDTGAVCSAPGFDHAVGDPVPGEVTVARGTSVVIVEGSYLFLKEGGWARVQEFLDQSWYKDVPIDESISRVLGRHIARMSLPTDEARRKTEINDRPNALLINQTKRHAQFVLDQYGNISKRPAPTSF